MDGRRDRLGLRRLADAKIGFAERRTRPEALGLSSYGGLRIGDALLGQAGRGGQVSRRDLDGEVVGMVACGEL